MRQNLHQINSWQVGVAGWLEAFAAHPRIGDVEGLKKKFGGFADMSKNEQAGAAEASAGVIEVELAARNKTLSAGLAPACLQMIQALLSPRGSLLVFIFILFPFLHGCLGGVAVDGGSLHMGTYGFSLGKAKQRKLHTS